MKKQILSLTMGLCTLVAFAQEPTGETIKYTAGDQIDVSSNSVITLTGGVTISNFHKLDSLVAESATINLETMEVHADGLEFVRWRSIPVNIHSDLNNTQKSPSLVYLAKQDDAEVTLAE
ncbi:MAG: hypothetical protein HWD92_04075 [Flavobacteriia bacterium]|nr:hypothetical protein [Flavobacteriia bacterium]